MINQFNHVQHHLRMTRKASANLQKANANLLKNGMTGTAEWGLEENLTAEMEDQEEPDCLRGIVKNVVVIIGVVMATPILFLCVMYLLDKNGVDLTIKPKPLSSQAERMAMEFKKNAPPELADCSFSVVDNMKVVRCPNSVTSTGYKVGKSSPATTVVIDPGGNQAN